MRSNMVQVVRTPRHRANSRAAAAHVRGRTELTSLTGIAVVVGQGCSPQSCVFLKHACSPLSVPVSSMTRRGHVLLSPGSSGASHCLWAVVLLLQHCCANATLLSSLLSAYQASRFRGWPGRGRPRSLYGGGGGGKRVGLPLRRESC